jgi:hypothetical protein
MGNGQNRDSKGRFVKGNTIGRECLDPATRENAAERGRKGGQACAAKMREQKMLKEVLREVLNEETSAGSGVTKMHAVVQNVLKNTLNKGKALDLKILAEILGEMEINVNLNQAEKPTIVFDDGEDE